uniref:Uncharacterized protein n=1 Tax=Eptatretus burgeri TaxID=7764 RepID=A0A8C4QQP3_EPTBU
MKFIYTSQYDNCLTYKRIFLPRPDLGAPLLPGLFKGTYGSHGLELVLLSFHGESAHVTKITGDPNVPAGQTSLQIDMSQPLVLDHLEQQQNLQALVEIVSQWETWQASTERQIYPEENDDDDDEARQEEAEGYSHSIPEEGRWLCRRLAQEAQDGGDKLEEQSEISRQKVAGSCCWPIDSLDRQCESDPFQAEGQSSSRPQQVGSIVAEEVVLEHDQSGEADAVQEANENGRACEEVMCPKVEQPVDEGQLRREMNIRWEREGQQVASREAQGLLVCEEFHLPPEVLGRLTTLPRICHSRYYGKGLIAGHGFTSPQQTPGIFVHFDDDTFGFLWLQLRTFSIYSRVHEYLPRGTAPSTRAFLDMLRELGTIQA